MKSCGKPYNIDENGCLAVPGAECLDVPAAEWHVAPGTECLVAPGAERPVVPGEECLAPGEECADYSSSRIMIFDDYEGS